MAPLFLLFLIVFTPTTINSSPSNKTTFTKTNTNTTTSSSSEQVNVESICKQTPYPSACYESIKISININISPSILNFALHSIQNAISGAVKLSGILSNAGNGIAGAHRGALQDCQELHQSSVQSLKKSAALVTSGDDRNLAAVRANLAAALTNRATCLDGLDGARGAQRDTLVNALQGAYQHVSNSLNLVVRAGKRTDGRRLTAGSFRQRRWPDWLNGRGRRILDDDYDGDGGGDDSEPMLVVSQDGTGNFTTITDALTSAPNSSDERTIIFIRAGVYDEHIDVPSYKPNIVFIGEGSDVTVITGSKSVGDGWTTFRSATVAVSGDGFLARDIQFKNTAGPAKGQAVALRVNADLVAFYRCVMDGYQDTHYVHSFRQFYRECDIYGTVDFIFGNAAVIFQACNIIAKKPLQGQTNMLTAQSKDDPDEDTGISLQNCTILASDELANSNAGVKTFLGRPWRNYSTTVVMESYIDSLVDPAGWSPWSGDQGLDTLYYGEYMNSGPGAGTDNRVSWPGFHVMEYDDAYSFTVAQFIYGDEWLDSTSFPYDDGI